MRGKRQKTQSLQLQLAFAAAAWGETPPVEREGTEPRTATRDPERPAVEEPLMEEVCERANLITAWKRVRANKGSAGVDGMTIDELPDYLREHWPTIRAQLLNVRRHSDTGSTRVEIPEA